GFWLKALALPCRMTPIAGLKEPAEAEAFASGGAVTGPIGQGSRGGVPIVKPDEAGAGGISEIATSGEGGGGGVIAAPDTSGDTFAGSPPAVVIGFFSAAFSCAS